MSTWKNLIGFVERLGLVTKTKRVRVRVRVSNKKQESERSELSGAQRIQETNLQEER